MARSLLLLAFPCPFLLQRGDAVPPGLIYESCDNTIHSRVYDALEKVQACLLPALVYDLLQLVTENVGDLV